MEGLCGIRELLGLVWRCTYVLRGEGRRKTDVLVKVSIAMIKHMTTR